MAWLAAVDPDRARVVDDDGVEWHLGVCGGDGHEAGFESGDVGHDLVDGYAGLSECGLGNGVVLFVWKIGQLNKFRWMRR